MSVITVPAPVGSMLIVIVSKEGVALKRLYLQRGEKFYRVFICTGQGTSRMASILDEPVKDKDELILIREHGRGHTTEDDVERIRTLAKEGRVEFQGTPPTLSGEPDWTITSVTATAGVGWIDFAWQTVSAGFGHLTFANLVDERDQLTRIDREGMSDDFAVEVFRFWLKGLKDY